MKKNLLSSQFNIYFIFFCHSKLLFVFQIIQNNSANKYGRTYVGRNYQLQSYAATGLSDLKCAKFFRDYTGRALWSEPGLGQILACHHMLSDNCRM